jgi:lysine 6-dehydrogenase
VGEASEPGEEFAYGILGAGRQGTAAAYDLAVRGEAASIVLADVDGARAAAAATRVNELAGRSVATGVGLDVTDSPALLAFLKPLDAAIGAVSYKLNLAMTEAAIEARTDWCDLGGNTPVVLGQLALDQRAKKAGVRIVPDCGEAPGLASNLMTYAMSLMDEPQDLVLLDGGLPLKPTPPWNYRLTFSMDGLTNEYAGGSTYIRDGKTVEVASFDPAEYELVDLGEPVGVLEAFSTGGASTTPWTLGKRLRSMRNKVIRYPGHVVVWKGFMDAGLFSENPVRVGDQDVVPRQLFHALIEPQIRATEAVDDIVIAHVIVTGRHAGEPTRAVVDMRVVRDRKLGFFAMEETTGWHAAIVAHLMAGGRIAPGAAPVELATDSAEIVAELRARGFPITETVEPIDDEPAMPEPGVEEPALEAEPEDQPPAQR